MPVKVSGNGSNAMLVVDQTSAGTGMVSALSALKAKSLWVKNDLNFPYPGCHPDDGRRKDLARLNA